MSEAELTHQGGTGCVHLWDLVGIIRLLGSHRLKPRFPGTWCHGRAVPGSSFLLHRQFSAMPAARRDFTPGGEQPPELCQLCQGTGNISVGETGSVPNTPGMQTLSPELLLFNSQSCCGPCTSPVREHCVLPTGWQAQRSKQGCGLIPECVRARVQRL